MDPRRMHEETGQGWELVAAHKYRAELEGRLRRLKAGEDELLAPEREHLGPLLPGCGRLIHLQCSHGTDALGLLARGVTEVVGVDISAEMIQQARFTAEQIGAAATFVCADVLDAPASLDGTADLVYTGKGALPWMMDIDAWAAVVARLLRSGGHLYVFEGHPLDALWDRDAPDLRLREADVGYFDGTPREPPGFPADVVEDLAPGEGRPLVREHHWRPGEVIASLLAVGLRLEHFDEHPEIFWNQFPELDPAVAARVPHSYSILARKP